MDYFGLYVLFLERKEDLNLIFCFSCFSPTAFESKFDIGYKIYLKVKILEIIFHISK